MCVRGGPYPNADLTRNVKFQNSMGYGGVRPGGGYCRGVGRFQIVSYEQNASGANLKSRGRLEMLKRDPNHWGIATFDRTPLYLKRDGSEPEAVS